MKIVKVLLVCMCCCLTSQFPVFGGFYSLNSEDYPTKGTIAVMETDTTSHAVVDVGSPGTDQTWTFTQSLAGKPIPYNFTEPNKALNGSNFSTAGWAVQTKQYLDVPAYPPLLAQPMVGFFETNYFEKLESETVYGIGISIQTPLYTGSGPLVKQSISYPFPLTMGKKWSRLSQFNFPISTLTAAFKDSAGIEVDATGKLTIPAGTFDCIRLKEIRTVSLMLFLFGWNELDRKTMIVYQWHTKKAGLLLEVTSHAGETNPNYTEAALVVRMQSSNATTAVDCGPDCRTVDKVPAVCSLEQNYPNPFNPSTKIPYNLKSAAAVDIRIYTLLGQEVAVLKSGQQPAGRHETSWSGRDQKGAVCPGGIYFCRMQATPVSGGPAVVQTRKMLLTD
jgi:hypothetical protein